MFESRRVQVLAILLLTIEVKPILDTDFQKSVTLYFTLVGRSRLSHSGLTLEATHYLAIPTDASEGGARILTSAPQGF